VRRNKRQRNSNEEENMILMEEDQADMSEILERVFPNDTADRKCWEISEIGIPVHIDNLSTILRTLFMPSIVQSKILSSPIESSSMSFSRIERFHSKL
jgi:hypothetical protein